MKNLTRIDLNYTKNAWEKLIFGKPVFSQKKDLEFEQLWFLPDSVFCLERWTGGKYGTKDWNLHILRAVSPGEPGQTIKNVSPGAEILLDARGKKKVVAVKKWLTSLTKNGIALSDLSAEYFIQASGNFKAFSYTHLPHKPSGKIIEFLKRRGGHHEGNNC